LAYIWKHAGRENVFGVVYDDAQQANFGLPFQRAMDPANPYRVEELRSTRTDSLAALDKDPNNLWVNLLWADLARSVGDYRVAVSEWFEVYFRVLAACRTLVMFAAPRLQARRIPGAYTRFGGLGEVVRLKTLLKLDPLVNASHWQQIVQIGKRWTEISKWLDDSGTPDYLSYVRNQIRLLTPPIPSMSTNPQIIASAARPIPRIDDFHRELVTAVPALEKLLAASEMYRRSSALEALMEIADPRCEAALQRALASSADAGWRKQLETAIGQIHQKVAERGAAWLT
jgi:hypothetical protein